jgi:hypothetical protein
MQAGRVPYAKEKYILGYFYRVNIFLKRTVHALFVFTH